MRGESYCVTERRENSWRLKKKKRKDKIRKEKNGGSRKKSSKLWFYLAFLSEITLILKILDSWNEFEKAVFRHIITIKSND